MTLPNILEHDPLGFWDRVARAARPLLGLDYDGTLAPFRVDRMAAVPVEGARRAIRAVIDGTPARVVVISGRRVADVLQLLGDLGVTVIGSHGYERHDPDGTQRRVPLTEAQTAGLARADELAVGMQLADRLERKAASLAFHTRGLAPTEAGEREDRIARLWSRVAGDGLQCTRFDGGVELRARGVDKGTVLADLIEETAPDLVVHVGDDLTDEDAFRVLRRRNGIGIKVGPGETEAAARLPNCSAVVRLLQSWAETGTRQGRS